MEKCIFRENESNSFKGICGIVRKIIHSENSDLKNMNFTIVTVESDSKAEKHYHRKTEEVYYVISGTGKILVESDFYNIKKDDFIVILPNQIHQLINNSEETLKILVINSPPYSTEDVY